MFQAVLCYDFPESVCVCISYIKIKNKLHDTKGIQMSHVTVAYA